MKLILLDRCVPHLLFLSKIIYIIMQIFFFFIYYVFFIYYGSINLL